MQKLSVAEFALVSPLNARYLGVVKITREQLYSKIWETSAKKVAEDIGISAYVLRRICSEEKVPVPPAGYRMNLQHGKAGLKPALPVDQLDAAREIEVRSESKRTPPTIAVKATLQSCHPLVRKAQATLSSEKPDRYNVLRASWETLNIRTSKAQLHRALLIMDALLKHFESVGWTIGFDQMWKRTFVQVDGEQVSFKLWEKVSRSEREMTKEEKQRLYLYDRYIYTPTGVLELTIEEGVAMSQKSWSDSNRHKVEDCLGEFVLAIAQSAKALKARKQKWAEDARIRAEAERRREEEQKKREMEIQRRAALEQAASNQHRAEQIRSLVKAANAAAIAEPELLQNWSIWAEEHAMRLDALRNGSLVKMMGELQ